MAAEENSGLGVITIPIESNEILELEKTMYGMECDWIYTFIFDQVNRNYHQRCRNTFPHTHHYFPRRWRIWETRSV